EWFEALDATATQTSARWADARVGERTAFGGGGAQRVAITARAEQTACDEQAAHEWPTEENVPASTSHDLFPLHGRSRAGHIAEHNQQDALAEAVSAAAVTSARRR